ncbi:MAG: GNAT family N-acetyltransferase [Chloroflexi bacterium]|nr:GNAT family N-acetyltransferase [Chloroflexota bacterium]
MTMTNVLLTTDRLALREFVEGDWQAVHEYASDPEVCRFMVWGPNTEEQTRSFIARMVELRQERPRASFELAIELREEGRLIGACGIRARPPEKRQGDIGYVLNSSYWGKGYATEAARALLAFGFERLGLRRIIATCATDNIASARVLEKVGMRREAHFREDVWLRDHWRDTYQYAILDHEWRRLASS